ncbi:MAG: serine/threonine protein kinase [Pyrinomonadaceae bacterium]|nr:serine/threonine protein kinase [Pyrinomonadaceae bacterium]
MDKELAQKVKELCDTASGLTGKERQDFLDQQCGDDAELRHEVETLLFSFEETKVTSPEELSKIAKSSDQKTWKMDIDAAESMPAGGFVAGTVLDDRYRIIGMLGKGGMGEVYKAEDLKIDQTVALKFLPEELAVNEDALRRFVGEVRNARRVSHENVCRVFDIAETGGKQFISMEFIEGDDLSVLLKRIGRVPSERAIEISQQICLGLNAIHKAGILHRDLKPANIIIDSSGIAKITDFGIAGIESEIHGLETRVGTPAYMSPEQITGEDVTQKSDIYSLGLLIYEIFTGKQAVEGNSIEELIEKHQTANPTNASEFVENIEPVVERLINRCLEKDPVDRPDSAVQVALALPGGNPLQVALEAGETPSPEMVAAAPRKGILKLSAALALVSSFIGLFCLSLYFQANHTAQSYAPLEKSPDVLRERAKEILTKFGFSYPVVFATSDFKTSVAYDQYQTKTKFDDDLERLRTGQPFGVYFWYRQSSENPKITNYYKIEENVPPLATSESAYVKLDVRGRLVELLAVPSESDPQINEKRETDWQKVFTEAGLNLAKFQETDSNAIPPVFADEKRSWTGTLADHKDISVRIEAAALNGEPVYFQVITPWDADWSNEGEINIGFRIRLILGILITLIGFGGGSLLAYRHFVLKRGDSKGAFKISVFVFLSLVIGFAINANHFTELESEVSVLVQIFSLAIAAGTMVFVLYIAVEPLVRRHWTDLLISWNRLLAGDFRDPMIGRDILIGALMGCFFRLSFFLSGFLRDLIEQKSLTIDIRQSLTGLSGTSELLEKLIVYSATAPVVMGFVILSLLLIIYLLVKRKTAATILFALLFGTLNSAPEIVSRGILPALLSFGMIVGISLIVARVGLVAMISTIIFHNLLWSALTLDTTRFYFVNTIVISVIGLGVALYAFYISLGDQNLFSEAVLKD